MSITASSAFSIIQVLAVYVLVILNDKAGTSQVLGG
jgi:hypothetical protein